MDALGAVSAETAFFIGKNTSGKGRSDDPFFFQVVRGQIETGVRVVIQLFFHTFNKTFRRTFPDGGTVVGAADVYAYAGRPESGSHGFNPFPHFFCGTEQMIIFGRIKLFPGENINIASEALHIIRCQPAGRTAVGQNLLVGQIGTGCFLIKEFPRTGDGPDVGDPEFFYRLKQVFKGAIQFRIAVPEDQKALFSFLRQLPSGINHPHSIA